MIKEGDPPLCPEKDPPRDIAQLEILIGQLERKIEEISLQIAKAESRSRIGGPVSASRLLNSVVARTKTEVSLGKMKQLLSTMLAQGATFVETIDSNINAVNAAFVAEAENDLPTDTYAAIMDKAKQRIAA